MKSLLIVLALATACASSRPAEVASTEPARDCGALLPAVAEQRAVVRSAPDGNSQPLMKLHERTPVCVSHDDVGFGFRRVLLPDGREGYLEDEVLTAMNVSPRGPFAF